MSADHKQDERLLEHNYDGIQEYDNPMPLWWLWGFYATIVFSVLYWFNVAGIGSGKGRIANYEQEIAAATEKYGDLRAQAVQVDEASVIAAAGDPAALAAGKETFMATCSPCHRPDAGGVIGPNLTDDWWIHGNKPMDMVHLVSNGVLDKGMPAWNQTLSPEQIRNVVAYVMSVHGTNPKAPREPEGTKVEPAATAATPAPATESK